MIRIILISTLLFFISSKITIDTIIIPTIDSTIAEISNKYNMNINIVKAILKVESKNNVGAINKRSKDYGIGQINIWNIKRLKLNKQKLLTNPYYSIEQGVKIMAWFKNRYEKKIGHQWITRYNCGVRAGCEKTKKSKNYLKKVYAAL